jgi:hypothetical protein
LNLNNASILQGAANRRNSHGEKGSQDSSFVIASKGNLGNSINIGVGFGDTVQ